MRCVFFEKLETSEKERKKEIQLSKKETLLIFNQTSFQNSLTCKKKREEGKGKNWKKSKKLQTAQQPKTSLYILFT
jgi:hypothetical protein